MAKTVEGETRAYLAVRMGLREDWDRFVLAPQATRTKKPESQLAEVAEKRARLQEDAVGAPGVTVVTGFHLLVQRCDGDGRVLSQTQHCDAAQAGSFLAQQLRGLLDVPGARCYCLDFPHALPVIVAEAARHGLPASGLLRHSSAMSPSVQFINPFAMLVPSSYREKIMDFPGLCHALDVPYSTQMPELEAEATRLADLVRRVGL